MFTKRARHLAFALVAGGAAIAVPLGVAVAASSPADPYFNFSVQPTGTLAAKGVQATVSVSVTCFPETSVFGISVGASERVAGGRIASGFGFVQGPLNCDGFAHAVPVTLTANGSAFKAGTAIVTADTFACTPNGCSSFHDEASVKLK